MSAWERFSSRFEAVAVAGNTKAAIGAASAAADWATPDREVFLPWIRDAGQQTLSVLHKGRQALAEAAVAGSSRTHSAVDPGY